MARSIKDFEAFEKQKFTFFGWEGCQVRFLSEFRAGTEDGQGFVFGEACKGDGFEPGGDFVGLFDAGFELGVYTCREAETDMDCRLQAVFEVAVTDVGASVEGVFEGRDHVADDIFRGVMQEGGEAPLGRHFSVGLLHDIFDE